MVKTFSKLITKVNRTLRKDKKNEWLVIHYVGAVSTAQNNCKYFEKQYRGASAHYFVDENSIWQCVEESDDAWHIGAKKYYNGARNSNSIGIEMCCKNNGKWYIEPETIENTIWLAKQICQKYSIPLNRVVRHYDCTHKNCPEPFVREPKQWQDFLSRLEDKPMNENEAITFLTERGIITTPDYWENALNYYKNVNYLLIKTAEYIKELESQNS